MAPDRGSEESDRPDGHDIRQEAQDELAARASEPQNFTLRSLLVGAAIGIVIAFSNTYFGLQTGWISGMAMPSALIGFAWFKATSRLLSYPFTPVENVLVQTVAGSVGTMPLGCGFVGVIPALEFLLKPKETPDGRTGLELPLGKLIVWALGICFFGVVFAVPLRKEVIIREKLKFPSGTATALMIGVLHGGGENENVIKMEDNGGRRKQSQQDDAHNEEAQGLLAGSQESETEPRHDDSVVDLDAETGGKADDLRDWKAKIRLLTISFGVSAIYTVASYFIPRLHDIPILGMTLANDWLWTLNPSPAYVGQGIIMGPATTLNMLLGAVVGWGILSPLAKAKGWAPGPVDDWEHGSKGWIVWVSLAIMLADAIVSLGWLIVRPTIALGREYYPHVRDSLSRGTLKSDLHSLLRSPSKLRDYNTVSPSDPDRAPLNPKSAQDAPEPDAPPEHQIGPRVTIIGLILSLGVCVAAVHYAFASLIPLHLTILSLVLALLLSIMGVRALGETDLNPVSGISKLTQLLFAFATPKDSPNAVIINLLAGAISESGALQAGDLLQDLKTGHLLGASPKAQFYGQLLGSALGAVVSAAVYKLYTNVYEVPGGMFQVPTGYVWVFTARLVTGDGLPAKVGEWAVGAAALFSVLTAIRIWGAQKVWRDFVPGGIAVAVGMYNTPSFTLARTIGGLISWYWLRWRKESETPIIILASGLILGEGLMSILNLGLASLKVPHL
ncbi:oligopeptide transporter-like protein [Myriangium duriaei CBS 260.36]|uniref:Oligopeptide transporter-like protein n=1 Tax=Myriangium duriaei CBS 260.36 TaxID=1168546 RepID=A0A9P4MD06_9PEZI|nr:oligopeptide transporter-like protein [Myriangium duriaei CBS 260.36]